ncbi:MAG: tyrosine-type recombinase/integrase [Firmicutes bacterium]|nr:tyrosine-type recombinase/integrase [Bacillota bacterium]
MENYIEDFRKYLTIKKDYSKNTVESYISDINAFTSYAEEKELDVIRVGKTQVNRYLSFLSASGKSSSTQARALASIRLFYHFLMLEGKVKLNPCEEIKPMQSDKKMPSVLKAEEIENLLSSPDTSTAKGRRDKAMLELLYATGMRASEIVLIKFSDINLDMNYCICSGGNKARLIPFGKQASEALSSYMKGKNFSSDDYLFGKSNGQPLSRQGFWKIIKEHAKNSGLSTEISPSMLRSSFAAHMIYNGADLESVQELMGFSDISALNAYSKLNKKRLMDVYLSSHPRA